MNFTAKKNDNALFEAIRRLRAKDGNADRDLTVADIQAIMQEMAEAKKSAKKAEQERKQREEQEKQLRKAKKEAEKAQKEQKQRDEHIRKVTSMELPMDWENAFANDERAKGKHFGTVSDALVSSLTTLGKVDIEYISSVTGMSLQLVIQRLKGAIYQNPDTWEECFYKGWETADEYLSGNLMRKWRAASAANEAYNGYFYENMKAIEGVLPPAVATEDIFVTLGSAWLPSDIIDDFIVHLMGKSWCSYRDEGRVRHDEYTGTWEIPIIGRYDHTVASYATYGTRDISALRIIEKTLNMSTVAVYDEVPSRLDPKKTVRVINKKATVSAIEKQNKIVDAFRDWIWKDEKRKARLEEIFENRFSCVKKRHFDGSFLTFPTMSKQIQLYPYQKNAVARILFSPNTLLAHDVGSGKTFVMIAAGMELKRMGLSEQNMFVVPNNIVGQWKCIFSRVYPDAKVLCVEPRTFTPAKRNGVLEEIRDGNYDAVIIAYSCFEMIPLSRKYYLDRIDEQSKQVEELLKRNPRGTEALRRKKKRLAEQLAKLLDSTEKLKVSVTFEELKVSRLFVDEAHNFKNVPLETKVKSVHGVSNLGSAKCRDMLDKVHYVQRTNNGGGVVLATGTPITNSVTDAFVMQRYLQSGELAMLDLNNFDSWVGTFAERSTEFEIDVDTSGYRLVTRFSRFHNLPELTALLSSVADFHHTKSGTELPDFSGYSDTVVAKSRDFSTFLRAIARRAEQVRKGAVRRVDDNMLKITTDGRKAALDMRLVDESKSVRNGKVHECASRIYEIYSRTSPSKSAQLVFCDTSTPKAGFNMYDELKRLLVAKGIPEREIAFVHDAVSESARDRLFESVREGNIRVLIGSTFKLGLGVNVQDRLSALHHLDVPWRPADMVQREGRILRPGNQNKSVEIHRYVTEGSFDAYSWQLLETKQRFIASLLSGTIEERSGTDVDDTVLSYAEVKALAVGNPLIRERVETANELTRLLTLQHNLAESRRKMQTDLVDLPKQLSQSRRRLEVVRADMRFYEQSKQAYELSDEQKKELRRLIFDAVCDNELREEDRYLTSYMGFKVILPANMLATKPFVWLMGTGRYAVHMGESETGVLLRLDNYLNGLEKIEARLTATVAEQAERIQKTREELAKNEGYGEDIARVREKLTNIDKELGVNENDR